MKKALIILIGSLWLLPWATFGQKKITGTYTNRFGSSLLLKEDATFLYQWQMDLYASWSYGKWFQQGKTIVLEVIPLYDTLYHKKALPDGKMYELFPAKKFPAKRIKRRKQLTHLVSTRQQGSHLPPKKLLYWKKKLFLLNVEGKPITQKRTHPMSNRQYKTHYTKR